MLTVSEVEQIILKLVKPIHDREVVSLANVSRRVVAENIKSPLDFPYWDNSAMDGYAVKFKDVVSASPENPVCLRVIEEIPAGVCPKKEIKSGEAARIFTGAMLPLGSDTIVIQEKVESKGDNIFISHPPQAEQFVRKKGSFCQMGDVLLPAGSLVNPREVAILANAQCLNVPVVRSPLVAVISTGDELISPEDSLQVGQIVDSNQYLISSFLKENGITPVPLGIIPDNFQALESAIALALSKADWVISTGGVSVGDYDYVDRVIEKMGGKIKVKGVKMKPGKPLTVADFGNGKLYFGIPGNPVSTMVTCWRLLKTPLRKLAGEKNYPLPSIVRGVTCNHLRSQGDRETYLWGNVALVDGYYQFTLTQGSHNSGNLINLQGINSLAIIPIGVNLIEMGDEVEILLIKRE